MQPGVMASVLSQADRNAGKSPKRPIGLKPINK